MKITRTMSYVLIILACIIGLFGDTQTATAIILVAIYTLLASDRM